MPKEQIIEFAKANNAPKGYISRLQKDKPLTYNDLCWASKHGLNLGYEVYLETVKQDGLALFCVPEEHKTPELCSEAVYQEGLALRHVPEDYRNYVLCLVAVKRHGWVLKDIFEKHKQSLKQALNYA